MFELSPALTKAQLQTMNTRNRQVSRFTRAATPQNVELTENIQFYGSIALFGYYCYVMKSNEKIHKKELKKMRENSSTKNVETGDHASHNKPKTLKNLDK